MADGVQTETERLKLALLESQTRLQGLGAAASEDGGQIAALHVETTRLAASAKEASGLLDTLARLVASVERFVAPPVR